MQQLNLPLLDPPAYDFSRLQAGVNAGVLQQVQYWQEEFVHTVTNELDVNVPLFICGDNGTGKTHVLRSMLTHLQGQGLSCAWFDAHSVWDWTLDRPWQLVFWDDVQHYDAQQQAHVFDVMSMLTRRGGAWVGTAPMPPAALGLREDVRTRFGSGVVCRLQLIGDADIRIVLERRAYELGVRLPTELLDFMLVHMPRRVAVLQSVLEQLDDWALTQHKTLSIALLRRWLEQGQDAILHDE